MSNVSWSFAGRTALVTGASRGLGLATANLFAQAGAHVFALSRTANTEGLHPDAHAVSGDVINAASLTRAARSAAALTGRVDICVANAGGVLIEDFATADAVEWSRLLDINVLGVMRSWQAALSYMTSDGKGGRLIATSSAAGLRGERYAPAYSATKAAIIGLVQAPALEYADDNITVNAVAPGRDRHRTQPAGASRGGAAPAETRRRHPRCHLRANSRTSSGQARRDSGAHRVSGLR